MRRITAALRDGHAVDTGVIVAREFTDGQANRTTWGWSGRMNFYPNAVSGLARRQLWKFFDKPFVTV
jgi:hypothetical protein